MEPKIVSEKRNFINYCLRKVNAMEISGQIAIQNGDTIGKDGLCCALPADRCISLQPGWAKRPPVGLTYGQNNSSFYKEDLKQMFLEGVANKSYKKSAARMLEELKRSFRFPK